MTFPTTSYKLCVLLTLQSPLSHPGRASGLLSNLLQSLYELMNGLEQERCSRTLSLLKVLCHLFLPIIRRSDNVLKTRWTYCKRYRHPSILFETATGAVKHQLAVHLHLPTEITCPIPTAVHFSILFTGLSLSRNRFGEIGASCIIWPKLHVQT